MAIGARVVIVLDRAIKLMFLSILDFQCHDFGGTTIFKWVLSNAFTCRIHASGVSPLLKSESMIYKYI